MKTDINQEKIKDLYQYVQADLNPHLLSVLWRVFLSVAVGGTCSLFFCGQFGVQLNPYAMSASHLVHAHMGSTVCAIFCGFVFTILPILILRWIATGVMFRIIMREYYLVIMVCLALFGIVMNWLGSFMHDATHVTIWIISAFVSVQCASFGFNEMNRKFF